MVKRFKKKVPKHVFERSVRIKNGVFQPKVDRKVRNSMKTQPRLDWIDEELKYVELEEKLKKGVLK